MAKKKQSEDVNVLAKSIIDQATQDSPIDQDIVQKAIAEGKDPLAVLLGQRGGLKGGRARAEKLTPAKRKKIAKKAAAARWKDHKKK